MGGHRRRNWRRDRPTRSESNNKLLDRCRQRFRGPARCFALVGEGRACLASSDPGRPGGNNLLPRTCLGSQLSTTSEHVPPNSGHANNVGRPTAEDQRTRILAATERLVGAYGFDAVRLRDIAKASELSIGSLQHHFETRDQLLRATFQWSCDRRIRLWRRTADVSGDPWSRLRSLLTGVLHAEDFRLHCAIWIAYSAAALREPEIKAVMGELFEQYRRPLREVIVAGTDAGTFTPVMPIDDIVDILTAQIDGLESASLIEPSGFELERIPRLLMHTAEVLLGASV